MHSEQDSPAAVAVPSERLGDWMHLFTGGRFYPLDPRPEEVHIEDIAHALSLVCRYQGHTSRFYSVAEHSLLVARAMTRDGADDHMALRGLLHDAAEAYLCDVVRPVKEQIVGYAEAERTIEAAIWERFGLPQPYRDDAHGLVRHFDDLILYDEATALLRVDLEPWHERFAPGLGVEIRGLLPMQAEALFLEAFRRLRPGERPAAEGSGAVAS